MSKTQRTALAAVIRKARETFYRGTPNWGMTYDTFVAERVLAYLEAQNTSVPLPDVRRGTKGRYRTDHPVFGDTRLAGEVRVVGFIRDDGGAEMLSEDGEIMDYRTKAALTPERFWADFEPVMEEQ